MGAGSIDWTNAERTARSNIPYIELPGYSERFIDEGTQSVRRLACRWYERQLFMLDVLGFTGFVSGKLRRSLPERQPSFDFTVTGIDTMWAVDMDLVNGGGWFGKDDDGALAYHDSPQLDLVGGSGADQYNLKRDENEEGLAIYDVTYRPQLYNVTDDTTADADPLKELSRYTIQTWEPAGENYEFPRGLLTYSGGQPLNTLPPVLFPTAIFNVLWLQIPALRLPMKTIFGYWDPSLLSGAGDYVPGAVGSVNDAVFLGQQPETLLCLPPRIRKYQSKTTDIYVDVMFCWQYRPQTHQRILLPGPGSPPTAATWDRLKRTYSTGGSGSGGTMPLGLFPTFPMLSVFDVSSP